MDTAGGLATEEKFNPLFHLGSAAEHVQAKLSVPDRLGASKVLILNPDLHLLLEVLDVDFHVLTYPARVLATVPADVGTPLLEHADLHDDKGIHLVLEVAGVVVQMGFDNVDLQVARVPATTSYDYNLGLPNRLLVELLLLLRRVLLLLLLVVHGLLNNDN